MSLTRRDLFDSAAALAVEPAGNAYIDPRKVLLWESTRKEFREALEGGRLKVVVVPHREYGTTQ